MTKKELIKKILELGKELEEADGIEALMIIDDLEKTVDKFTEQIIKNVKRDCNG